MALNFSEASKFARSFLSSVRGRLVKPGFLEQPSGPSSMVVCTDENCATCSERKKAKRGVRVVFLCFAATHPNGGVKVIYRQSELVAAVGVESCVFQPDVPDYNTKWFSHGATVERVGHFDPRHDFLVVPELMATVVARFCIPAKIRYAIYVQNGYIMNSFGSSSAEEVELAYLNAALVLAISDDTAEIVTLAFPSLPVERLLRMRLSVRDIFKVGSKEKIITFMPRKLREHTALVMFFLRHHVPPGWSVLPIDQMSEEAVADTFARSGIFLSFSHLEGLGLPPIEAALAGNIVVGYTGEGGREFFKKPIFRKVNSGDFLSFIQEIENAVIDFEQNHVESGEFEAQRAELREFYSNAAEIRALQALVRNVTSIMQ